MTSHIFHGRTDIGVHVLSEKVIRACTCTHTSSSLFVKNCLRSALAISPRSSALGRGTTTLQKTAWVSWLALRTQADGGLDVQQNQPFWLYQRPDRADGPELQPPRRRHHSLLSPARLWTPLQNFDLRRSTAAVHCPEAPKALLGTTYCWCRQHAPVRSPSKNHWQRTRHQVGGVGVQPAVTVE